jgi:hypothetical protein
MVNLTLDVEVDDIHHSILESDSAGVTALQWIIAPNRTVSQMHNFGYPTAHQYP